MLSHSQPTHEQCWYWSLSQHTWKSERGAGEAHLRGLVGGGLGPHAELVLLAAHVDDDAADLVALGELLADARQQLRTSLSDLKVGTID